MEKAYKYRIYPNKKQQELMQKTFGCVRFVYNYFLAKGKEVYQNENRTYTFYEAMKDLTTLKHEYEWLYEPDKCSLQNAIKDLYRGIKRYFAEGFNYPHFKTKKQHQLKYRSNCSYRKGVVPSIEFVDRHFKLPKLGWIKTKDKMIPEGKIVNVTVSQEPSGKYYATVCCIDVPEKLLPKTNKKVGIDVGIREYCTTSDGEIFDNPKFTDQARVKLIKLQQSMSRKTRYSKNWEKARKKFAREWNKIFNRKRDFLQKLTTYFIRNYDVICLEDLQVPYMIQVVDGYTNKQRALARRKLADVSWGEFMRELEYKAKWYGKEVKHVDHFYASSQICSECGSRFHRLKDTSIREWKCPNCGTYHNRDINAAINIMNTA